ncbi:nitroreductase [Natronosporangium hydrolyticum]|uniref:Nitroreductase n=1 Tax=Natronosporangium hydrolyticum TaxID=2811111 RepID=A0A895YRR0_9ACTN|nr:nitroreductase [Natronosporangium hydrolyticum]QSB16800.1 nitroreductase [Natronosporangium hydrolyticum]
MGNGQPVVSLATALREAAAEATRAPSILNTQPWRWRVHEDLLELHADWSRQVTSIDPAGRLLTLSCGAALHHARVTLAAAGHEPVVTRPADPDRPDLLAEIRAGGRHEVSRSDTYLRRSIRTRRSDRRPFPAIAPVPAQTTAALHRAAEAEQARIHRVGPEQVVFLRAAAELAQRAESADDAYLRELRAWVRRHRATGEGVPPDTFVAAVDRPIPLRDFSLDEEIMLHPGFGDDQYAEYLILATAGDAPADWLRAGEATSAVWLTATHRDLAVSVLSDVVEVPDARELLRSFLHGRGHPQLVLRVGFDMQPVAPKASPRRPPEDTIEPAT